MSDNINLVIKWAGKEIPLDDICVTTTVGDLKRVIEEKTSVLPGRQKLLNLKYKGKRVTSLYGSRQKTLGSFDFLGKPATDDLTLCALALKSGTKIMMMGSSEQVRPIQSFTLEYLNLEFLIMFRLSKKRLKYPKGLETTL
jgi:hypothetical protein